MEKKGVTNVPISGIDDKKSITMIFSITIEVKLWKNYSKTKGKTTQSLPKVKFPTEFWLSVNESHYSNEKESFKLLEEIILPLSKESEKVLIYQ